MEIALGVALGILGVALAVLAARLVARRARPASRAAEDDLPAFLESPPGTAAAPARAGDGWAALASSAPAPPPSARRPDGGVAAGALAAVGVLLVALAVALLTGRDESPPHRAGADGPRPDAAAADGVAARLTFGGVVLERHAVGVTAAYPRLELTTEGERSIAHLELPTYNCLTDRAPADPVAAGCSRSATEYAELEARELSLTWSGDRLRLSGEFPTYLRATGGPSERTGRAYRIEVTAVPTRASALPGWQAAEGSLELGPERTATVHDPGVNVLRRGS